MPRDISGPSTDEMGIDPKETQVSSGQESEPTTKEYSFSARLHGSVEEQSQAIQDYGREISGINDYDELDKLAGELEDFSDDLMKMREGKMDKGKYEGWSNEDLQELEANVNGAHTACDNALWDLQEREEDWQ